MENARDIRRRINAVSNTRQITRAMELVARTKLQRTQEKALSAQPYSRELRRLLERSVGSSDAAVPAGMQGISPLLDVRPVESTLILGFSADRGLCGAYNSNVIKRTARQVSESEEKGQVRLIAVGQHMRDHFRRGDVDIFDEFVNIGEEAALNLARTLSQLAQQEFAQERADQVYLVYTEFESVFSNSPVVQQLLPVTSLDEGESQDKSEQTEESADGTQGEAVYIHEPTTEELFKQLLPRYVDNALFRALTDAKASEQAARVVAMKNATDNAEDLIEDLTRDYNRVRQTQITREINEIASGAEALAEQR